MIIFAVQYSILKEILFYFEVPTLAKNKTKFLRIHFLLCCAFLMTCMAPKDGDTCVIFFSQRNKCMGPQKTKCKANS